MNTGLGQAINCFSAQMGPGHPWKERKRPCREVTDFPITKNHSFFQRLRDSGAHPFFTFSSLLLFRPKGWMGEAPVTERASQLDFAVGTCSQVAGVQEKEGMTSFRAQILARFKLHKRDFLKVQWLRIHTSIAGCLDLIPGRELKFHMPCGQNKTNKTAQETEGRWRDFLLTASNTWTPAPPRILGFTGHTGQTFLQAAFTYCF